MINTTEQNKSGYGDIGEIFLNRMAREGLDKNITFELKPERREG